MYKLNKKNVDKTVLMLVNRAIRFKVNCVLEDEATYERDSFWMAQCLNCHALIMLDTFFNEMGITAKEFFETYCEDNIEVINSQAVYALETQLKSVIIPKIETFIYNKEEELLNTVNDLIRQETYNKIEKERFERAKRAM